MGGVSLIYPPIYQKINPERTHYVMFNIIKFGTEEPLLRLVSESKEVLRNSIQIVQYPSSFRKKRSGMDWSQKYRETDKLNQELLKNISNKAGVYTLFSRIGEDHWEFLYIGQTQAKTARQRIRSHIVWRNKETESGQFTGSKFDEVQEIIMSGKELGFSFIEVQPASLRHYVEEKLIEEINPLWNKHKTNKNKV